MDAIMAESPKALAAKVGHDVVVPRIKLGFEEAVNSFLSGMLWGGNQPPVNNIVRGTVLRGGGVNYNQISSSQPSALAQARIATTGTTAGNYEDVRCSSQHTAEVLLANMYDLLNQFRVVAVGDLYEAAGITPSISDGAYGWTSLDGARIVPVGGAYVLQLPRPTLI